MKSFRWTKQQDFCLRLGQLKTVVAILQGLPAGLPRDDLKRRLDRVLFSPADESQIERLEDRFGRVFRRADSPSGRKEPGDVHRFDSTLSSVLIVQSDLSSWGQPINLKTSYKIVEWARVVGLTTSGNRLSERGRVLYSLFPKPAVSAFVRGEKSDWNPYALLPEEKVFFFYHLGESDELLWRLALRLGRLGSRTESIDSIYKMTLEEMQELIRYREKDVSIPEVRNLRVARELSVAIESELFPSRQRRIQISRGPRPRPKAGVPGRKKRQSHKNADHQTVPRLEQLVDIGLLRKPIDRDLRGDKLAKAKKAWSFEITDAARAFADCIDGVADISRPDWHWRQFAESFSVTGLLGRPPFRRASREESVLLLSNVYESYHRFVGQTPFESLAILTMIEGLRRGLIVEISELHGIMLEVKHSGGLRGQVYFAAGNDVDQMFVSFGPEFPDAFRDYESDRERPRN